MTSTPQEALTAAVDGALAAFQQTADWPELRPERMRQHLADCISTEVMLTPGALPAAPPTGQAGLRDRIRRAVCEAEGFAWDSDMLEPDEYGDVADMVLAVLPAPVDRDTVLREAADGFDRHAEQILDGVEGKAIFVAKALRDQAAVWREAAETLRRLAAETPGPETQGEAGFTEARAAFMQIGRTPSLEGLRAELRIEGWPPIVGSYNGAAMRRMHDIPGHEHLLAIEPSLIFEYADHAPAVVAEPDKEA